MMTPRPLDEALPLSIYLRRVAVHAAQQLAFRYGGYDLGTTVPVWGGESTRLVVKLNSKNGETGAVFKLVFKKRRDLLARAGTGLIRVVGKTGPFR